MKKIRVIIKQPGKVPDDEFDSLGLSLNDFKTLFKFLWRGN